ncbi:MAG: hypothetical protein AAGD13_24855 [Pseudomonadota bacterium]
MVGVLLLCIAACTSGRTDIPAAQAGLLSIEEFSARFAELARQSLPDATVDLLGGPKVKVASGAGASRSTWFPDNAYREYRRDPADLDDIFERQVSSLEEFFRVDIRPDSDNLLACVRAKLEEIEPAAVEMNRAAVPIAGDLHRFVCRDSPRNIAILNKDAVADARSGIPDFDNRIIDNITRLSGPVVYRDLDGLTMVTSSGNYEASLILVDAVWAELVRIHGPDLAFTLPSRDLFIVTSRLNSETLEILRTEAAKRFDRVSYSISPLVYGYRDGEISVLRE